MGRITLLIFTLLPRDPFGSDYGSGVFASPTCSWLWISDTGRVYHLSRLTVLAASAFAGGCTGNRKWITIYAVYCSCVDIFHKATSFCAQSSCLRGTSWRCCVPYCEFMHLSSWRGNELTDADRATAVAEDRISLVDPGDGLHYCI